MLAFGLSRCQAEDYVPRIDVTDVYNFPRISTYGRAAVLPTAESSASAKRRGVRGENRAYRGGIRGGQ